MTAWNSPPATGGLVAGRRDTGRRDARPQAGENALAGDEGRATATVSGVGDAVHRDDRVGGLGRHGGTPGAHLDATSASAKASLTPSPTMMTGRSAQAAHDVELVLGRLVGVDAVDTERAADAGGNPVAFAG